MNAAWPLIMVMGAFFAGQILIEGKVPAKWEPGWDMLSALGTIAAVWAAVLLAGAQQRRERQQLKLRAVLLALRVYTPLSIYAGRVEKASTYFRKLESQELSIHAYEPIALELKYLLDHFPINEAELEVLTGLESDVSMSLAEAYGHIKSVEIAEALMRDKTSDDHIDLHTGAYFLHNAIRLQKASKLLLAATEVLSDSVFPKTPV